MAVRRLRPVLLNLAVAAFALVTVTPLAWMVAVSLMAKGEANRFPAPLIPREPTLANYRELLVGHVTSGVLLDYHVLRALWNSIALASLAAGLSLLVSVPAGYAFAKLRWAGRARLFQALLIVAVIPGQVAMLPLFLMLREIGLVNSYAGVLAPSMAAIFATLLVRQAALAIPDALLDSARLDGAGEALIFVKIVMPLLRPVIVTLALFAFLASWSDFLWPLIVLSDQRLYTLPVALSAISREHLQDTELQMAGAVVTTLPVLLIFLALQRHYFSGMLRGAIKG